MSRTPGGIELGSLGVALVLRLVLVGTVACRPSALAVDVEAELSRLSTRYQIEIETRAPYFVVKTAHGDIACKTANPVDVERYTRLFVPEFSLYPSELVRRTRLRRVVFCTQLTFGDQQRGAVPDFEHGSLYLNVDRGSYDASYQRKVIHHEFFHIIDYMDDGVLYSDRRWVALNPPDVKYGSGGQSAQGRGESAVLTTKFPGFLDFYSTTGVEEDKAEVFANLLVNPRYVERRAATDQVLKAKVERMKELLVHFSPDTNDEFWSRAAGTVRRAR